MPQLIKPSDVKILTKDGEVKISITLDLNVNIQEKNIHIKEFDKKEEINTIENIEEKTHWQIPDFNSEQINFGKEKK